MCSHEKKGSITCVRCEEEEAEEVEARLGTKLSRHQAAYYVGTLKNGVPRKVDQFVSRVVTARVSKIPGVVEPLLQPSALADGRTKLSNSGAPLAYFVQLAKAEKDAADDVVNRCDHADEWWDHIQGVCHE